MNMTLAIKTHLAFRFSAPADVILQVEAAETPHQIISAEVMECPAATHTIVAEHGVGLRRWVGADGLFRCDYSANVCITRQDEDIAILPATPLSQMPGDALSSLMPSRYCQGEMFDAPRREIFGTLSGGALIAAVSRWIGDNFTYAPGASDTETTAVDSFMQRRGVCRDYAHVLIAFARSAAIPARMASVYGPDVSPQDFHAIAQVYLDGAWRLVDPTGMSRADETAIIGVGRDAADVAFMTSFGFAAFEAMQIEVSRV